MIVVDLLLDVGRIFGDLRGDAHRNILPVEHFGQSVDQLAEFQTRADIGFRLAELAHEALDRMSSRLQGPLVGGGLLARTHVLALQVLCDGGIFGLGVRQLPNKGRDELQTCHRSGPVAALAVDDLETLVLGAHADRLKNARLFDAFGKFQQRILTEVLAGIVGRIDDLVQVQQPDIRFGMGCRLFDGNGVRNRCLRFGGFRISSLRPNSVGNDRHQNCGLAVLFRFRIHFRSLHNM